MQPNKSCHIRNGTVLREIKTYNKLVAQVHTPYTHTTRSLLK